MSEKHFLEFKNISAFRDFQHEILELETKVKNQYSSITELKAENARFAVENNKISEGIEQECKTCKFYDVYANSKHGICRKNAPVVINNGDNRFPEVFEYDWCGEHKLLQGRTG